MIKLVIGIGEMNSKVLVCSLIFLFLHLNILSQKKDYKIIVENLTDKAWTSIIKESDSAIHYCNKILSISKKEKYSYGEMLGFEYRGIYKEAVLNNYKEATEDYLIAIRIAEKYHIDYLPDLYISMGILFGKAGNDYKAIKYLEDAKKLAKKESRTFSIAIVNLAIVQSKLAQYEKARLNFEEFLKITDLSSREREVALLGLGKNLTRQKKFKEAVNYYSQALEIDSLNGNIRYSQHYSDVIDNAAKIPDKNAVIKFLNPLHKSFSKVKSLREKLGYYQTSAIAYKLLEDYVNASIFQDSIIYANDILNKERYNQDLSELETKYQTKKKEEQILEEQNQKKLWSSISILAFIILIIVIILLSKNRQKRKQLNANKIELEKLLNQRNMLLKETHHRVKNSFQMVSSLLQLQAQGSEAEVAITALDNAVQRVNSMIVLHQQLYAKDNLLGVDLKVYINDLVNEILQSYSSKNISINADIISTILDIDTATSIGLLVNELATNSIKYAWDDNTTEKTITLKIHQKEENLHFEMFDNGSSKKTNKTKQNYGSELIEILIERLDAEKETHTENDFGLSIKFKNG